MSYRRLQTERGNEALKFSNEQVDEWQLEQANKKWIQISGWDALLEGEILK